MTHLAEEILRVAVRRGSPRAIGGLVNDVQSPIYTAAIGLAVAAKKPEFGADAHRAHGCPV